MKRKLVMRKQAVRRSIVRLAPYLKILLRILHLARKISSRIYRFYRFLESVISLKCEAENNQGEGNEDSGNQKHKGNIEIVLFRFEQ